MLESGVGWKPVVDEPGLSRAQLEAAVSKSGYPFQGMVIDQLLEEIGADVIGTHAVTVQEEWSFVDADTESVRQIDGLVTWQLTPTSTSPPNFGSAVEWMRVHLVFLVECKQSELPFVAFVRDSVPGCQLPVLYGLPNENVEMLTGVDEEESFVTMSVNDALGMWDLGMPEVPAAVSIAKVRRKGADVELSGEDVYKNLALPILKALEYLRVETTPQTNRLYFDVRIVFPLAVVKAPLVEAKVSEGAVSLNNVPWVRLLRTEPNADIHRFSENVQGFDVVQFDYLQTYVHDAIKAAQTVVRRIAENSTQVLLGKGVVDFESMDDEDIPFAGVRPHVDAEGLAEILRKRFREVHAGVGQAGRSRRRV